MIIGTTKELKNHEYRVGLTPDNVALLVSHGHTVLVETHAGEGAAFYDEEYASAGARICQTAKEIWDAAEMIIKVKEPEPCEYDNLREGQILYTYLHLAPNPDLTNELIARKVKAVAYETITDKAGALPCLRPMSQIAGKLSIQEGAKYLERSYGGRGLLLGSVPGVERGKVVIIGGGVAGTYAAKAAVGIGAQVTLLDINLDRLAYLDDIFGNNITTLHSTEANLVKSLRDADVVVGAVLIPGAAAPKLIRREHLKIMQKGAVIVDIAIDQGGCCESSRVSSHDEPVYIEEGIVHYCVGNMPGAVPHTSTIALTNSTINHALRIADLGLEEACRADKGLMDGLNIYAGHCVNRGVADSLNIPYVAPAALL